MLPRMFPVTTGAGGCVNDLELAGEGCPDKPGSLRGVQGGGRVALNAGCIHRLQGHHRKKGGRILGLEEFGHAVVGSGMAGLAIVCQMRVIFGNGPGAEGLLRTPLVKGYGNHHRYDRGNCKAPEAEASQVMGASKIAQVAGIALGDFFL